MRVGSRISVAEVVAFLLLAIPANAATLPQTLPIDPQGTYFATQHDPPTGLASYGSPGPPTRILLSTINAAPGDRLRLTSRGRYNYTFWQPDLLTGDAIARFVGASGSVPLMPAPQGGNYSTVAPFQNCPDRLWDPSVPTSTYNDPNDFALFKDNPITIVVPAGATAIEFGTFACLIYDDRNTDDFRVDIDYADSAPTLRNPLKAALKTGNYFPVDATQTLNAATTSALSADGKTAVVVAWVSPLPATEVTFAVSPYGTMSAFNSGYLVNPGSGNGNSVKVGLPTYQDAQGYVYLALLWAPDGLPLAAGSALGVDLTVNVTQAGVGSRPATIRLVPPPLLLVHGIWSSAMQAQFAKGSGGLLDWIATQYPHDLIRAVDYGPNSHKAFDDATTQHQFEFDMHGLLTQAAGEGVAARQVDVAAHSMGGLVTKYFLHNPPQNSPLPSGTVHKLVPFGTPHKGSALATEFNAASNDVLSVSNGYGVTVKAICIARLIVPCSLKQVFASLGRTVDSGVMSLMPENPVLNEIRFSADYRSIVGQAPAGNATEAALNMLIGAFLPGKSVTSILGTPAHDTIVAADSQGFQTAAGSPATAPDIVHSAIVSFDTSSLGHVGDTGETASHAVWGQVYFQLTGHSTTVAAAVAAQAKVAAIASATPPPIFDLTGYTLVGSSNVSFSPPSGSTLTIGAQSDIAASSDTKTITELLLFQNVVDPADAPLLFATAAPFSVPFVPARIGSASFVAIVLFGDLTYAVVTLDYTLQPLGSPLGLTLGSGPVGNLTVGRTVRIGASAGYPSRPIDVTEAAAYTVRSGAASVIAVGPGGEVTATGNGTDWLDVAYLGQTASVQIFVVAPVAAAPPNLVGAVTRRVHGAAGTFDLALSALTTNPTTEPRFGPVQNVVFTFDKPVTAGNVAVIEGTAIAGTPTFAGNEMTVPLTGVANQQYVTVGVTNVAAADGGIGGAGSIRVGFLSGDVSQNRVVTLSDLGQVNAQVAQQVTNANFLKDVNASGTLSLADKGLTNAQLTKALPPP